MNSYILFETLLSPVLCTLFFSLKNTFLLLKLTNSIHSFRYAIQVLDYNKLISFLFKSVFYICNKECRTITMINRVLISILLLFITIRGNTKQPYMELVIGQRYRPFVL